MLGWVGVTCVLGPCCAVVWVEVAVAASSYLYLGMGVYCSVPVSGWVAVVGSVTDVAVGSSGGLAGAVAKPAAVGYYAGDSVDC